MNGSVCESVLCVFCECMSMCVRACVCVCACACVIVGYSAILAEIEIKFPSNFLSVGYCDVYQLWLFTIHCVGT